MTSEEGLELRNNTRGDNSISDKILFSNHITTFDYGYIGKFGITILFG